MQQLNALIWVKWRLFLSQLRSPHALWGQLLLWMVGLVLGVVSVGAGAAIFVYLRGSVSGVVFHLSTAHSFALLTLLGALYLMAPMTGLLPTRGGGAFDPSLLLHYPLSLHRLFAFDLVSELLKGVMLLMLPTAVGLHLALPVAGGHVLWGLPPLAITVLLSLFMMKIVEHGLAHLNRRGRDVGEGLAAGLVALLLIAVTVAIGAAPRLKHTLLISGLWWAEAIRWTPVFLIRDMLEASLFGDGGRYLVAGAALLAYLLPAHMICYGLWRRLAVQSGGGRARPKETGRPRPPWRGMGVSNVGEALLEKELKYLIRNPQVRVLLLLPGVFLLFKLGILVSPLPPELGGLETGVVPEGGMAQGMSTTDTFGLSMVLATAYLMLFYGVIFNNLFGMDGHGVRSYLVAPVPRIVIFKVKNLALLLLITLQGLVLLGVNQLVFKDLTRELLTIATLSFLAVGGVMAGLGNIVSVLFPKRIDYGRRLEASRWGVLFMAAEVVLGASPLLLAGVISAFFDLGWMRYVLSGLGVALIWTAYGLYLLPEAARLFEERETRVLNTITGGDE